MTKQEQGETLETFIIDLKTLATAYNYRLIVESLVRDRIVCGILYHQLRERLLRIPDLTLDTCADMCRAAEITKQGISVLIGNINNQAETVNKVSKGKSIGYGKPLQKQNKPSKLCAKSHEPS